MPPPRQDIPAGSRFGALAVVTEIHPQHRPNGRGTVRMFVVRCACDATRAVSLQNLRSGNTQSCGCKAHRKIPA